MQLGGTLFSRSNFPRPMTSDRISYGLIWNQPSSLKMLARKNRCPVNVDLPEDAAYTVGGHADLYTDSERVPHRTTLVLSTLPTNPPFLWAHYKAHGDNLETQTVQDRVEGRAFAKRWLDQVEKLSDQSEDVT